MIYIQVELWPYGNKEERIKIAEAYIENTLTGDAQFGNYEYTINENCQDPEYPLKVGWFFGHERKQGVWPLIKSVLKNAYPKKNKRSAN